MKICFIVPTLDPGGIENYLLRFINFIKSEKYEVTVICKSPHTGALENEYKKTNCTIIHQPLGYLSIVKVKKYLQLFKSKKYDTLVDFTGNFAGIIMFLAYLSSIQNRITFYRRSSIAFKPKWYYILYDKFINVLVFNFSTKILSNSFEALNYFFRNRNKDNNKFKVIKNGINPEIFKSDVINKVQLKEKYKIPKNKIIIGHVGRYDPAKNHNTIFKVAKLLSKDKYQIVFCGLNTDSIEFKTKLNEFEIVDQSTILGTQNEVVEVLNTFDVFLFPSITEGQPNALIEAIMCKVPILASNINPIKEVIPKNYHSMLFSPLDYKGFKKGVVMKDFIKLSQVEYESFISTFNHIKRFEEFENELWKKLQ